MKRRASNGRFKRRSISPNINNYSPVESFPELLADPMFESRNSRSSQYKTNIIIFSLGVVALLIGIKMRTMFSKDIDTFVEMISPSDCKKLVLHVFDNYNNEEDEIIKKYKSLYQKEQRKKKENEILEKKKQALLLEKETEAIAMKLYKHNQAIKRANALEKENEQMKNQTKTVNKNPKLCTDERRKKGNQTDSVSVSIASDDNQTDCLDPSEKEDTI